MTDLQHLSWGPPPFQPPAVPPSATSALPSPTYAPSPPPTIVHSRRAGRSNVLGWVAVSLCLVLLAVAIAQSVFLLRLSERADRQASALRATNTELDRTRSDLDAMSKRIAGVDDRTKGTLNSAAVARKILPSVFRVRAGDVTGTAFAFGPASGGGTLLVTNFHVVRGAVRSGSRQVTIERTSERHTARIVKMDERRDIAVLQVAKVIPPLTPAKAAVQPGQPVVVVGAPLGLADSVTTGVVSAVRSDVPGIDSRVIQFDAAISPGNSGGPVSNADGQVVGVAQAKIVREDADGLALAIPISEVCDGLVDC